MISRIWFICSRSILSSESTPEKYSDGPPSTARWLSLPEYGWHTSGEYARHTPGGYDWRSSGGYARLSIGRLLTPLAQAALVRRATSDNYTAVLPPWGDFTYTFSSLGDYPYLLTAASSLSGRITV